MPRHIGMVAVSPVGASLCNRQIFRLARQQLPHDAHPTITTHNIPFSRYVDAVRRDDWRTVSSMLCESARVLADAGAEFCFTADSMVQYALPMVECSSPIPWVNMAELVAQHIANDSRAVVAIFGTTIVMTGSTYQATLGVRGIRIRRPELDETNAIEQIILDELAFGSLAPASLLRLRQIALAMRDRGCDALLFGCSEAPELDELGDWPMPTYDSCTILAREVLRRACEP